MPKRIPTKNKGVFYKEIEQTTIDNKGNIKTKIIDKVYLIRYRDGDKERLITLGKYSQGIREAYCKAQLNKYLTLAKNGELPPQIKKRIKKDVTTLNDLAKVYFDAKEGENRENKRQHAKYERHIQGILGDMDIHKISKDDIRRLQKSLANQNKAPKTINGITTLLKAIINYSIKEKDLNLINPVSNVQELKVDNKRERFLSLEEIKLLIEAVKYDALLYPFVRMSLSTGARLKSVLNIQKKGY